VIDVSESLKLGLGGVQQSVDRMDKRVQDYIAADESKYRGIKWMRLPLMQGTVTAAGIAIGESNGQEVGPEEGYAWRIGRLILAGLTSGTDLVNLFRSSTAQQGGLLWQFNGANFGYTFGEGQMTLFPGDRLQLANAGTITTAVGTQITLSGELVSVPAEMLAKIIGSY
jgi:hypothetical protein